MTKVLLAIERLRIEQVATGMPIVQDVSLVVAPGEVVALIGESGSGKTSTCLATLGHVRAGLRVSGGEVNFNGVNLLTLPERSLRALRGRNIAYVAQSAAASFNPSLRLTRQVTEPAVIHGYLNRTEANTRALDLYRQLNLPEPEKIGRRYPHQVSGGQLQRLMAAMAMCCDPELMVLDEPTTALDVTTQIGVLKAFKDLIRRRRVAVLYVSHDLAIVSQMADRVVVLRGGVVQEEGTTQQVLEHPRSVYTQALVAARQDWRAKAGSNVRVCPVSAPILELQSISAGYGRAGDITLAVKSADLSLRKGAVLGIVGESGSGKSSLARVVAGLLPVENGSMRFDGKVLPSLVSSRDRATLRRIQIVLQSSDVSLNPAHSVDTILSRPLAYFHGVKGKTAQDRVCQLLESVQLPPSIAARYPLELSGGQKQRISIARALAAEPDVIICDEITSALDTVVSAAIIDLLRELRTKRGLSLLFISHDISTVAAFADDIAVMHLGRIVEQGAAGKVLGDPSHIYTKVLVSSVPQLRIGWLESAIATRQQATALEGGLRLRE